MIVDSVVKATGIEGMACTVGESDCGGCGAPLRLKAVRMLEVLLYVLMIVGALVLSIRIFSVYILPLFVTKSKRKRQRKNKKPLASAPIRQVESYGTGDSGAFFNDCVDKLQDGISPFVVRRGINWGIQSPIRNYVPLSAERFQWPGKSAQAMMDLGSEVDYNISEISSTADVSEDEFVSAKAHRQQTTRAAAGHFSVPDDDDEEDDS